MLVSLACFVEADPYSSKKGLSKDQGECQASTTVPIKRLRGVEVEVGTEGEMFNLRSS
jgi:hypothetical protein